MNKDVLDAKAMIRSSLESNAESGEIIQRRIIHELRAATCEEDNIIRASDEKTHKAYLGGQVGIGVRE